MKECSLSYQWVPQQNPYRPGQSEMVIQHAERKKKKKPGKNTLSSNINLEIWRRNKRHSKIKTEGAYYQQTCLTRNA